MVHDQGVPDDTKVDYVTKGSTRLGSTKQLAWTERKDGVIPAYNIRTDKWDIALTAMDQVNKNWETKNMEKPGTFAEDVPEKTDGGTPSLFPPMSLFIV